MTRVYRGILVGLLLLLPVSPASAELTVPLGGALTIPPGGTLGLGCTDLAVQGSLTVGSGQIGQAATVNIGGPGVLDGGSGSISVGGNWNNSGTFIPGTSTVTFSDGCGASPIQLTGNTTFYNLTLISTTGTTFVFPAGSQITVTGTLTLQGAPGLPIHLASSSGLAVVNLGPGAQIVSSNVIVPPTVQLGAVPLQVPALSEYGVMALALLLAAMASLQVYPLPFTRRNAREKSHGDVNHGK